MDCPKKGESYQPATFLGLTHSSGSMKAVWNDVVLAESDSTKVVEGNQYFPPDSIKKEYFKPSATHSVCSLEGDGELLHRGGKW